jgi:hypothetical protein
VWKIPYQRLSRSRFLYVKEEATPFTKGLLPALPHCKEDLLASFYDTLGMKKVHLRWVSHTLDTNQKAERVTLSHGILSALRSIRFTGFQSAITRDESRFFLYFPRDLIWAASRDDVPERVSQKINTEKCLISLLWSLNGIHSPVDVLKGSTDNSTLFCDPAVPNVFDGITLHSRRSTWTVRVRIMQGDPLDIFTQKRSEVSHVTQITSSNLGFKIGLTISRNLPRIMIRLRDAV